MSQTVVAFKDRVYLLPSKEFFVFFFLFVSHFLFVYKKPNNMIVRLGAIDGARTRDLRLGKPPLCQLSYYRSECYP